MGVEVESNYLSSAGLGLELYVGSSETNITVKNEDGVPERASMMTLVRSRCPSLFEPLQSPWWLNNGHLQTCYSVVGDFSKVDKVEYNRILLRLKDGGTIGVDFTPPFEERTVPDDAPIVVVGHGLTGGSHESYVRAVLAFAVRPKEEGGLGYRAAVVNFRGCAGVPITSGKFYSPGYTDDLRQACVYIQYRYPKARLLGVGFSLGANVMIRYMAQEGRNSRLRAGCSLGSPWDLQANADRLHGNFFLKHTYAKSLGHNLQALAKLHEASLLNCPEDSLVDDVFNSQVGGGEPWPFKGAEDYYEYGSSHHVLGDVCVPLLAINAADDPIVGHVPYDVGNNGHVALALTSGGGHLGWFEGGGRRWFSKPVIEWLKVMGEDLIPEYDEFLPIEEDKDGWIWEKNSLHPEFGVRVLENAGIIEGVEGEGGLLQGL